MRKGQWEGTLKRHEINARKLSVLNSYFVGMNTFCK